MNSDTFLPNQITYKSREAGRYSKEKSIKNEKKVEEPKQLSNGKKKKKRKRTADLHYKLKEIEITITDDIVLRHSIGLHRRKQSHIPNQTIL